MVQDLFMNEESELKRKNMKKNRNFVEFVDHRFDF